MINFEKIANEQMEKQAFGLEGLSVLGGGKLFYDKLRRNKLKDGVRVEEDEDGNKTQVVDKYIAPGHGKLVSGLGGLAGGLATPVLATAGGVAAAIPPSLLALAISRARGGSNLDQMESTFSVGMPVGLGVAGGLMGAASGGGIGSLFKKDEEDEAGNRKSYAGRGAAIGGALGGTLGTAGAIAALLANRRKISDKLEKVYA